MFNLMAKRRGYLDAAHGKAKGEAAPGDEEETLPPEGGVGPEAHHAKLVKHHKAIAGLHEALAEHHGGKGDGELADHHSEMAAYHHKAAAHHGMMAAGPSDLEDEEASEPAPGEAPDEEDEEEAGPPKHGIAIALAFGKPKPPDTIKSAKFGPIEDEEEETPEHEAGESKEVEAIEEARKEQPGTKRTEGGSLRNSLDEEALSKKKGGFRKFPKKAGERA